MKRHGIKIFLCFFLLMLNACHRKGISSPSFCTPEKKPWSRTLDYEATLEPILFWSLSAPFDGTIASINFHYGQAVKAGDILMTLHSETLQDQFYSQWIHYLKEREAYFSTEGKWRGVQELMSIGSLSKNQYHQEVREREERHLNYVQAKKKLEDLFEKMNEHDPVFQKKFFHANPEQSETFMEMFQEHPIKILIRSPHDGIVLAPSFTEVSEGKKKPLTSGLPVKASEPIVAIGDLHGIAVHINVHESELGKIKVGQKAKFQNPSLPDLHFEGKVEHIDLQAENKGQGPAVFSVRVVAESLPVHLQKLLRVGTSLHVHLLYEEPEAWILPLSALRMDEQGYYVEILEKPNQKQRVEVQDLDAEQVAIRSGVSEKDHVRCTPAS